ncbi:MAG: tetratricopeptide repeat protein [Proteobacteria bacterium]|nr:tetratricopeptide repeat protein [Pseudomonadota bacterium]
MPINLCHRPAATVFLIAGMVFTQQVVRSAESDTTDIDSAPTPVVEFQVLFTAGRYADALAVAARVADQASDYQSATRASLVEPLMKLAMVQKRSGDYLMATRAAESAIELIERNGGVFDPELIEPLIFLAQLEQDNGHHPAALERLNRAQHILHRAEGVMSHLQLPILAYMTKSYTAMKQTENTNTMIEQAFAIKSRDLDQDSIEYVPIVLEQAEIRAFNGQFRKARELIYFAMEILDQSLAENDPGFVDALNGLAFVRYQEQASSSAKPKLIASSLVAPRIRFPIIARTAESNDDRRPEHTDGRRLKLADIRIPTQFEREIVTEPPIRLLSQGRREGTRALQKMIHIMEQHRERFSAIKRAEAHIWLGDWYMIIRKPDLADDSYRAAWQRLADEGQATDLLASYFGQPKRLKYRKPAIPRKGAGMYENYDGKYVEVRYSVDENGRVRKLKLGDSNSPAAMNTKVRSAVKRAIFRPRYEDGQAVATDNLFFREEFSGMLWWLADATD